MEYDYIIIKVSNTSWQQYLYIFNVIGHLEVMET